MDGTKIAANAGLSANRSYEKIGQEVERILAEADEVDAAEDEQFGDARGDELPAELADPVTRRARLEHAKREIEAEQAALVAEHEAMLARRAEHRQRTGRTPRGRPPGDGPGAAPPADAKRNITDPDSRIMHARGALIQAFNAQALVGEGRLIIAADITTSPNDSNQLEPMLAQARENLDQVGQWLSHKSTALERSPTRIADATPEPSAARRSNVEGRPSRWTNRQQTAVVAD